MELPPPCVRAVGEAPSRGGRLRSDAVVHRARRGRDRRVHSVLRDAVGESARRPARRSEVVAATRPRHRPAPPSLRRVPCPRRAQGRPRRRSAESDGRDAALRARRDARAHRGRRLREGARVSRLRAKCPDCKTFTAVALGPDYECHSCGRSFGAGLVRVPQAWGDGGEAMAEAAWLELPYPETSVVEAESLEEQSLALAADLPERPLVLGGCCCSHIGAVEGLAARQGRISLVWFDAHGDLNTPESSPSGNAWGMPLRMLLDSGAVEAEDTVLVGARELDPPEEELLSRSTIRRGAAQIEAALENTDCVYVAWDADVADA